MAKGPPSKVRGQKVGSPNPALPHFLSCQSSSKSYLLVVLECVILDTLVFVHCVALDLLYSTECLKVVTSSSFCGLLGCARAILQPAPK